MSGTDFLIALADLIDERIYSGYKLYGTNFAAHDKLHGSERLLPNIQQMTYVSLMNVYSNSTG
jgi:hypothetical protein